MVQIKVAPDSKYEVIQKVGSIDLDWDMSEATRDKELEVAAKKFVRAMELRGMSLVPLKNNPSWVWNKDGTPMAVYAIDWLGERKQRIGVDGLSLPKVRETSLEDSEGMAEYRIVGVFWSPEAMMERIVKVKSQEEAARHRGQIAYGGSTLGRA